MKLRIACGVAGIFQSRRAISNNDCILDRSPDCKTVHMRTVDAEIQQTVFHHISAKLRVREIIVPGTVMGQYNKTKLEEPCL